VLRWHTRMPVADPERVTDELVLAIKSSKATYVAVHVNHPRELSHAARTACARLIDAGIPLLSQSVLLKGVNDDVATLEALMRALIEARIHPIICTISTSRRDEPFPRAHCRRSKTDA